MTTVNFNFQFILKGANCMTVVTINCKRKSQHCYPDLHSWTLAGNNLAMLFLHYLVGIPIEYHVHAFRTG